VQVVRALVYDDWTEVRSFSRLGSESGLRDSGTKGRPLRCRERMKPKLMAWSVVAVLVFD